MKRVYGGLLLAALGVFMILLPYHIEMSGLVSAGYGFLLVADWFVEQRAWKPVWRTLIRWIGIVVSLILIVGMSIIGLGGRSQWNQIKDADYAVVLGAQTHGDRPSRTLRERLDVALRFLQENPNAIVIVSGGQGSDEIMPESAVMARYLEDNDADMERVYLEDQAHNTRENLQYSTEIAESLGIDAKKVVIITSEFHMRRAKYIAGTLGIEAVGVSSQTTPGILAFHYTLREVFAFVKAWAVAGVS